MPATVQRRRFSAAYRLRILKAVDACKKPGGARRLEGCRVETRPDARQVGLPVRRLRGRVVLSERRRRHHQRRDDRAGQAGACFRRFISCDSHSMITLPAPTRPSSFPAAAHCSRRRTGPVFAVPQSLRSNPVTRAGGEFLRLFWVTRRQSGAAPGYDAFPKDSRAWCISFKSSSLCLSSSGTVATLD